MSYPGQLDMRRFSDRLRELAENTDGNAIGGVLAEVFVAEVTAAGQQRPDLGTEQGRAQVEQALASQAQAEAKYQETLAQQEQLQNLGEAAAIARLLDAASAVIRRDGAQALTLDAVAAEAGVSKGGLLYHFKSKRELLDALVRRLHVGSAPRPANRRPARC